MGPPSRRTQRCTSPMNFLKEPGTVFQDFTRNGHTASFQSCLCVLPYTSPLRGPQPPASVPSVGDLQLPTPALSLGAGLLGPSPTPALSQLGPSPLTGGGAAGAQPLPHIYHYLNQIIKVRL